jgi:prepilin-type N-terminal cleavage/methylation domain-containing protein
MSLEMLALSRLRDERGFTLIEVLVTMLILVVGIAGAIAMIDGANARTLANKEREAGNALTREVIEAARSVPYRQLNATTAVSQLQAIPGLEDSTPSTPAWTVERRNQVYAISLDVCSVDDDQDKLGTTGGGFCAAHTATDDANPDDYKRISVDIAWKRGGVDRNIKQVGIVNNEASSAGPSVEFTNQSPGGLATTEITSPASLSSMTFTVQAEDGAVVIRFAVDGVLLDTSTSTNPTFTWHINSGGTHIPDGTYIVSVTAFDAEGTPGPTKSRTIRLNRDAPVAPEDVFGGFNPRWGDATDIVELQWVRNTEPDVTGYRVYRKTGSGDEVVPGCDQPTAPSFTDCIDHNPPAGATIDYYVVALDQDPSTGLPREGAKSLTLTATRAATKPNQPATLTAVQDDDSVVLTWADAPAFTPPYTGSPVIFYRVYRDGTALTKRWARTGQESLTAFRDIGAAAGNHQYYVTTVDENFSESDPLGPVAIP